VSDHVAAVGIVTCTVYPERLSSTVGGVVCLRCVAAMSSGSSAGWAKAFDERYGRDYYYNHELNITQWDIPEGYQVLFNRSLSIIFTV
jgi:hypothetical protein